jgi:hypothetical protein
LRQVEGLFTKIDDAVIEAEISELRARGRP